MQLTDATVAALKVPAGKVEHFVWDPDLPGFGVRIRALSRRWVVQYRVGGQQRRESLGDIRRVTLEAARKIARQKFAKVTLGQDPAAEKAASKAAAEAAKVRLGAVADRYLKIKQSTLRPSTHRAAARYFETHWKALRGHPLNAITRAQVANVLQEITLNHGRIAAARARGNLSTLYGWAMREGLCESNPVIATNDPEKGIKPRERILSDDEIKVVWDACQDGREFGKIVRLLLLCGCRREEIGGLMWSEIDLTTGVLIIPGERTKNHRELRLTLAPAAIEILRAIPRRPDRTHVFGRRDGFQMWNHGMAQLHRRIAVAIGQPLPHFVLHDLRRTMRSGLGRLGVAPHVAELCIGHARTGVQAIYDRHHYGLEIQAALAIWADHVTAVVEGRSAQVVPLRA
jgi:integrase